MLKKNIIYYAIYFIKICVMCVMTMNFFSAKYIYYVLLITQRSKQDIVNKCIKLSEFKKRRELNMNNGKRNKILY